MKEILIPASEIIYRWREELQIDVEHLLVGVEQVVSREDPDTGLVFFNPPIAGDSALYEALQSFPWYYLENKWEYEQALCGIKGKCRILEVGCGRGAFLRKARSAGHDGIGIELNSEAATVAQGSGLDVRTQMLDEFLLEQAGTFDRVYSFQVLEHVVDPVGMLHDMSRALRQGGRICFAVPNADSFIRRTNSILDLPPHHISRWCSAAIRRTGALIGAREVIVYESPLEEIHFDWWMHTMLGEVRGKRFILNPIVRALGKATLHVGAARLIKGHSVYAEFIM